MFTDNSSSIAKLLVCLPVVGCVVYVLARLAVVIS